MANGFRLRNTGLIGFRVQGLEFKGLEGLGFR